MEERKHDEQAAGKEGGADEPASLDEMLATRPEESSDDNGDDIITPPAGGDRVEALSVKVVPKQPTEFTCKSCFLVKHRSQLANKKRMLCRDCA